MSPDDERTRDERIRCPKCMDTYTREQSSECPHRFTSPQAKVEPVSKDKMVISIAPGYRAVTFKLANGGAECVILDRDATETTRLAIAPPQPGHVLKVKHIDSGVEIVYRAKP